MASKVSYIRLLNRWKIKLRIMTAAISTKAAASNVRKSASNTDLYLVCAARQILLYLMSNSNFYVDFKLLPVWLSLLLLVTCKLIVLQAISQAAIRALQLFFSDSLSRSELHIRRKGANLQASTSQVQSYDLKQLSPIFENTANCLPTMHSLMIAMLKAILWVDYNLWIEWQCTQEAPDNPVTAFPIFHANLDLDTNAVVQAEPISKASPAEAHKRWLSRQYEVFQDHLLKAFTQPCSTDFQVSLTAEKSL